MQANYMGRLSRFECPDGAKDYLTASPEEILRDAEDALEKADREADARSLGAERTRPLDYFPN